MNKNEFEAIREKARHFSHSSMDYIEFEDISDYAAEADSDRLILLHGYNKEAKCGEYHWAAQDVTALAAHLRCKAKFTLPFVPRDWVPILEKAGLRVQNAWHDYFLKSLGMVDEKACDEAEFLTARECAQASQVTQACRGLSRGFTGQTPEWISDWIGGRRPEVQNGAVLVARGPGRTIIGVVCTGTYGHGSENGPIAWIREAAVLPAFQNRGIARRLITQALAYDKLHGARRGFLAVDENNVNAIRLYRDIGFEPSGEESEIDMVKNA
jgi:ribosomal protein S18 acetylase RimI-like enzyme